MVVGDAALVTTISVESEAASLGSSSPAMGAGSDLPSAGAGRFEDRIGSGGGLWPGVVMLVRPDCGRRWSADGSEAFLGWFVLVDVVGRTRRRPGMLASSLTAYGSGEVCAVLNGGVIPGLACWEAFPSCVGLSGRESASIGVEPPTWAAIVSPFEDGVKGSSVLVGEIFEPFGSYMLGSKETHGALRQSVFLAPLVVPTSRPIGILAGTSTSTGVPGSPIYIVG